MQFLNRPGLPFEEREKDNAIEKEFLSKRAEELRSHKCFLFAKRVRFNRSSLSCSLPSIGKNDGYTQDGTRSYRSEKQLNLATPEDVDEDGELPFEPDPYDDRFFLHLGDFKCFEK